jgi:hypothetical protein
MREKPERLSFNLSYIGGSGEAALCNLLRLRSNLIEVKTFRTSDDNSFRAPKAMLASK